MNFLNLLKLEVKEEMDNGKVKHYIEVGGKKFRFYRSIEVEQGAQIFENILEKIDGQEYLIDKAFADISKAGESKIKVCLAILKNREIVYEIVATYLGITVTELKEFDGIDAMSLVYTLYQEYKHFFSVLLQARIKTQKEEN